jgi:hypothetical protein
MEIFKRDPKSFNRPVEMKRSCSFFAASSVDVSSEMVSGRLDGER